MQLKLEYQKKVKEVKETFNNFFPYLKIEFIKEKQYVANGEYVYKTASPYKTLGSITGAMREGIVTIRPENTVAEVINLFQNKYGLPVQIFHKLNDSWMETEDGDTVSMEKLNEISRAEAEFFHLRSYRYTMML